MSDAACPECQMLRDQIAIAREERIRLPGSFAAEMAGTPKRRALRSIEAAERSLDRTITAPERQA